MLDAPGGKLIMTKEKQGSLEDLFEALAEGEKEAMRSGIDAQFHRINLPWFALVSHGKKTVMDCTEMIRYQTKSIPQGRQLVEAWYGILGTLSKSQQPRAVIMQQIGHAVEGHTAKDTFEKNQRPSKHPDRIKILISSMVEFDGQGFAIRFFTNMSKIETDKNGKLKGVSDEETIVTNLSETAGSEFALADACSWAKGR